MSPDRITRTTAIGRLVYVAAATVVLAAVAPVQAQMPARPGATVATLPATPAAMVAAPSVRPAPPPPATPVTPPAASAPATEIACSAPPQFGRLERPLRHTARRLANGESLTIVAIGSSSTAGAGASSPAASYPSRLAVELSELFPGHGITVLNRGVNGEETPNMMARFPTGVFAEHPQLVLWQVGTNSVLRDEPLKPHGVELHEGIEELKDSGADVMLIDPQYAPKVLAKPEVDGMVNQIALTAKDENIDLFRRFAVMRYWYETRHLPFAFFLSPDQLHMNDWSYACLAKLLAADIAEAATRPIASAAAHPPR